MRWRVFLLCAAGVAVALGAAWGAEQGVIEDQPLTATGYHSPACSPDGQWIAFLGYSPRPGGGVGQDVYIMSTDGTVFRRLTSRSIVEAPQWDPNSNRLVCAVTRQSGERADSGLWYVPLSLRGRPNQFLKAVPERAPHAPVFSPDGRYLAYIHYESDDSQRFVPWVINLQRLEVRKPLELPAQVTLCQSSAPVWARDSHKLRFLAYEEKGRRELGLWEVDVESGKVGRVHVFPEGWEVSSLAYSPDGKRLAYIRKQGDVEELVVADERGANPVAVAEIAKRLELLPKLFESDVSWLTNNAIVYVSGANLRLLRLGSPEEAAILASRRNLLELYSALRAYARLHKGYLPSPQDDPQLYDPNDPYFWVLAVAPYLRTRRVLYSPADAKRDKPSSYELNEKYVGQMLSAVAEIEDAILLQEREAYHNGKRVVLYANGKTAVLER